MEVDLFEKLGNVYHYYYLDEKGSESLNRGSSLVSKPCGTKKPSYCFAIFHEPLAFHFNFIFFASFRYLPNIRVSFSSG